MTEMHTAIPASDAAPLMTLRSPPLRRVLCALNFQPILRVADPTGAGIAPFQDAIRGTYPELRKESVHELEFRPNSAGQVVEPPSISSHAIWQFSDSKSGWGVSLSRGSLSLEANGDAYVGRNSLIERFVTVVRALHAAFDPIVCTRLGFRYLNLFSGDQLAGIRDYLRPEILGYGPPEGDQGVRSSFTQTEFRRGDATYLVKHGFVEAGFVPEMALNPLDESSWLLDIDGFATPEGTGGEDGLRVDAIQLTNGVCDFFRESVTTRFLEEYRDA